jgi:hypothetical protein
LLDELFSSLVFTSGNTPLGPGPEVGWGGTSVLSMSQEVEHAAQKTGDEAPRKRGSGRRVGWRVERPGLRGRIRRGEASRRTFADLPTPP